MEGRGPWWSQGGKKELGGGEGKGDRNCGGKRGRVGAEMRKLVTSKEKKLDLVVPAAKAGVGKWVNGSDWARLRGAKWVGEGG